MKKEPFIALLITELMAGMMAMGLLLSSLGVFSYLVAAALFAVMLRPLLVKLKKAERETTKEMVRRKILLVMLIPIGVAIVAVAAVVIALSAAFGV